MGVEGSQFGVTKTAEEDETGLCEKNVRKIQFWLKDEDHTKYIDLEDPENANFCLVTGFLHDLGYRTLFFEYDASKVSKSAKYFLTQELVESRFCIKDLVENCKNYFPNGGWYRWIMCDVGSKNFYHMNLGKGVFFQGYWHSPLKWY